MTVTLIRRCIAKRCKNYPKTGCCKAGYKCVLKDGKCNNFFSILFHSFFLRVDSIKMIIKRCDSKNCINYREMGVCRVIKDYLYINDQGMCSGFNEELHF
ncbi:MAG: hypothetical protein ABIA74_02145 [bacterium]